MWIAVLFIAIGLMAFGYQGITYQTREKAFDIGNLQVTTEKTREIPFFPIAGGIALGFGIFLLVTRSKKTI